MENLEDYVAKEGWMEKKGAGGAGKRHNWKRRWLVLKGNFLYYYESDKIAHRQNPKQKGVVALAGCVVRYAAPPVRYALKQNIETWMFSV